MAVWFAVALPCDAVLLSAQERIVILVTVDGLPAWMWNNPTTVMPNVRRLARESAIAEAMPISNPSVTWLNHTTLSTGVTPRKQGVLFNGLLLRSGAAKPPHIEPWRDKAELLGVKLPQSDGRVLRELLR